MNSNSQLNSLDFVRFSQRIAKRIQSELIKCLAIHGYVGDTHSNPDNLKSTHICDHVAERFAEETLSDLRQDCSVYVESFIRQQGKNGAFYIDPIDGSANWDRGVGDPCVVIAYTESNKIKILDDLSYCYVLGLRSRDEYWADDGRSFYKCALTGLTSQIKTSPILTLDEAIAYLRPGYGLARSQMTRTQAIAYAVRDVRAFDNAGMEIAEISRGAADLMVEARAGSDGFNLLAWPLLRNAGGTLLDLDGNPLNKQPFEPDGNYDYIACANRQLGQETVNHIQPLE